MSVALDDLCRLFARDAAAIAREHPVDAVRVNVLGTATVAEATRRCGGRLILGSTLCVYGIGADEEDDRPQSTSPVSRRLRKFLRRMLRSTARKYHAFRSAAPSAIRRPMQDGQKPRFLHENGTRNASPHVWHAVRTNPCSKSPLCGAPHNGDYAEPGIMRSTSS